MNRESLLDLLGQNAPEIRRRFDVKRLAVFGSVARDEAGEASDVDVLVEFIDRADFDRFMDLKFHLEELLGTRVDLVTVSALRPQLRRGIEQESIRVA